MVAGDARISFEKRENMTVVSPDNFLNQIEASQMNTELPVEKQPEI